MKTNTTSITLVLLAVGSGPFLQACSTSSSTMGHGGGGTGGASSPSSGSTGGGGASSSSTSSASSGSTGGGGASSSSTSSSSGSTSSSSTSSSSGNASSSSTSSSSGNTSSSSTSSSSGTVGGACGGAACRAGQSCVQNACVYQGCTGAAVPGDYATIQAAVTALAPVGGTICLTAPSYSESVIGTATEILTIQGVSAASTMVTGRLNFSLPVHLQGFQVTGEVTITAGTGTSSVANMTIITPTAGFPLTLFGSATVTSSKFVAMGSQTAVTIANAGNFLLDGIDVSSPTGIAIHADDPNQQITIQNSYIHDTTIGLYDSLEGSTGTFVNNTFVNAGSALVLTCIDGEAAALAATYENNLFVNNQTAVTVDVACGFAGLPPLCASNGYYGNVTNFSGTALEGAGDVKTNPLLQTTVTPPTLGAGSPAIGAGLESVAPATDYWGNPRGASVDLGCVQSP